MFIVPARCVHCERRPDLNSKRCPFTLFCFVPVFVSRSKIVAARHPTLASVYSVIEFGGIIMSATGPQAAPLSCLLTVHVASPSAVHLFSPPAVAMPSPSVVRQSSSHLPLAQAAGCVTLESAIRK